MTAPHIQRTARFQQRRCVSVPILPRLGSIVTMPDAPICPACGNANRSNALFCDRCTYPLGVIGLNALSEGDKRLCLSHLFEQLAASTGDPRLGEAVDEELWRAYLSAFWLRPETAIVEYREALAIREAAPGHGSFVDLGCGDGIHTAISRGFRFDESFDAFQSLDLAKADAYDAFDPTQFYAGVVARSRPADVGLDIKPTAIARATALGAISRVERADATRLPLETASVGTIFSNMLRDLGEPLDAALAECARVLNPEGTLLLSTMTELYAQSLVFSPAAHRADVAGDRLAAEQLLRLDRGRSVFCRRQLSAAQWGALLAKHDLHVSRAVPILSTEATRLWDVGLRPFSADILAWRQRVGRDELLAVKRVALPILDRILRPIVARAGEGEPCMQLLVVRKGDRP